MIRPLKTTLVASATAAMIVSLMATPTLAQEDKLTSEEAKISYGLGLFIGERLKEYEDLDFDLLAEAIKARHSDSETLMSMEEAQTALQAQQQKAEEAANAAAAENAQKSEQYLTDNKAREGVMVTDSGLQYEVITAADGAKPTADDTVSVHYTGTFIDGTVFDSSVERGEPASFPLANVIAGWTEGLQLMNVGSKYRFVIPADLAYGDGGGGRPAGTLIFDVELLEIL